MNTSEMVVQHLNFRSAFCAGRKSASLVGSPDELFRKWLFNEGHHALAEYDCLLELEKIRDDLQERLRNAQQVYEKQLSIINSWGSE